MRFLVTANPKHPVPAEMVLGLSDAMVGWAGHLKGSGKAEAIWGFAGVPGGMAILNVDSAEELDGIMAAFPFGPFSEVRVTALVDVIESVKLFKQAAQAMMSAGGGR